MNPNCDNCGGEDAEHVLCEACISESEEAHAQPLFGALTMLADAVRAYIKAKDQDRVKEFNAMKLVEKKVRKSLLPGTDPAKP